MFYPETDREFVTLAKSIDDKLTSEFILDCCFGLAVQKPVIW